MATRGLANDSASSWDVASNSWDAMQYLGTRSLAALELFEGNLTAAVYGCENAEDAKARIANAFGSETPNPSPTTALRP